MSNNPLLFKFNEAIDFKSLTVEHVQEATNGTIADAKSRLEKIYSIPREQRTFENTMLAYDELYNDITGIAGIMFLLFCTSADEQLRNECSNGSQELERFSNELSLDENLFRAISEYSETEEATTLSDYKEKMLTEVLREFKRNGLALPEDRRNELKAIQNELIGVTNEFYKNIAEHQDTLVVSEEEIAGLPDDYKKQHRNDDGTYTIKLDYPSYQPFMQYAHSDTARKNLYTKFLNRASGKNIEVLQRILVLRKKIVDILGYPTFAAYRHENLMTKKPETVWDFEYQLSEKVAPKAKQDYDELLNMKREKTGDPSADKVYPWESGYYRTFLMKEKYNVDPEKVKEYFELNNVLKGIFVICEKLFGITFEEVNDASVWHEEVRLFDVKEHGRTIGRMYLDLFPRDNKYSHAACFTMIQGRTTEQGYQLPTLTLVCNFPRPTEDKPSLLRHNDVETTLHEFGHGLHVLLTQSPVAMYAGTNTVHDFVEVPSQIFENWAWHYDSLKLFATHYATGEVLPKDLYDKMVAAKNLGSGLFAQQQLLYGIYDMTLHDRYDPEGAETTTDILRRLQNEITLYPYLEDTHFQAAFGHLTNYAASYYGYMWSKVYAEDMFSVFEEKGIFDSETGKRYRELVLAKGGTIDEMQQLLNFLEREPSSEAFLRSLGLEELKG